MAVPFVVACTMGATAFPIAMSQFVVFPEHVLRTMTLPAAFLRV